VSHILSDVLPLDPWRPLLPALNCSVTLRNLSHGFLAGPPLLFSPWIQAPLTSPPCGGPLSSRKIAPYRGKIPYDPSTWAEKTSRQAPPPGNPNEPPLRSRSSTKEGDEETKLRYPSCPPFSPPPPTPPPRLESRVKVLRSRRMQEASV